MAKKPTLLELAKKIKPVRAGAPPWIDTLTPEQRKQFDELVGWWKNEKGLKPNKQQLCELIGERFGNGEPLSHHTLRKYIR